MKIITKRVFEATPFQLWTIVSDPENMPVWNPKCASCQRQGDAAEGTAFIADYKWGTKAYTCNGTIVNWRKEAEVVFEMIYKEGLKLGTIEERFTLKPKDMRHTALIHTVDFSRSTLPYWVKLLIGYLGRFGQKKGQDSMDHIQGLLDA